MVNETELCQWPYCECEASMTDECPKGLLIKTEEGHEQRDFTVLTSWQEEAFLETDE